MDINQDYQFFLTAEYKVTQLKLVSELLKLPEKSNNQGIVNAMTKPAVVVTGGAGYIGPHVCKALSEQGWLPITIDNLSTGNASAVSYGPLEIGDLGDQAFVDAVFQ